jgi:hypothetical protein
MILIGTALLIYIVYLYHRSNPHRVTSNIGCPQTTASVFGVELKHLSSASSTVKCDSIYTGNKCNERESLCLAILYATDESYRISCKVESTRGEGSDAFETNGMA